jgi:hypothetical protein
LSRCSQRTIAQKRASHSAFPYKDAAPAPGAAHGLTSEQLLDLFSSVFKAREDSIRLGRDDQLSEAVTCDAVMGLCKLNRNDRANPCPQQQVRLAPGVDLRRSGLYLPPVLRVRPSSRRCPAGCLTCPPDCSTRGSLRRASTGCVHVDRPSQIARDLHVERLSLFHA